MRPATSNAPCSSSRREPTPPAQPSPRQGAATRGSWLHRAKPQGGGRLRNPRRSPHRLTKLGQLKEDSHPTLGLTFLLSDVEDELEKTVIRKMVAVAFAKVYAMEYLSRLRGY